MSRRPEILDYLRKVGIKPIVIDGWETRGSTTFDPRGSVNHHTAGPVRGNHPSLSILIHGHSALPGPLCNVSLARNLDVYLIAAGRANHAGLGGWQGLSGNSSVWGLEVEHTGVLATEPFPSAAAIDRMAQIHAAFALASGFDASMVCQHYEWTTRKIDFVHMPPAEFRALVHNRINAVSASTPPEEEEDEDMKRWIVRDVRTEEVFVWNGETLRPANDPLYRGNMKLTGAITPSETNAMGVAGEWFNWPHENIEASPILRD